MFNNNILTEKFFDIIDDSRNLSYKKYNEEKREANFWLPYCDPRELNVKDLDRNDFDLFFDLGSAIKSGDLDRVSDVINGGHRITVEAKFVARCFTRAKYEGRHNAKLTAESLSNFVNAAGLSGTERMAQLMVKDHRTLQQNKMRLFVQFCQEMAKLDNYKDARNEASVKLAQAVLRVIEEEDIFLPYI